MQETIKRSIAIRAVSRAFKMTVEDVQTILSSEPETYQVQPALSLAYLTCIEAIPEVEQTFHIELYAALSDIGACAGADALMDNNVISS